MGDAQPKYLNSPETAFFRKGENLFGIEKAGSAIREAGCFHLVEGYVDVLAMHQAGVANTVAPLGTALTEQQVRVLKRWTAGAPCWCSTATRRAARRRCGPSSCASARR